MCWQRADIWSLGCTVIEMVTGKPPFIDQFENTQEALLNIASSTDSLQLPHNLSPVGKDFLSNCITGDAPTRLSPSQILHHPFVAKDPNPPPKSSRYGPMSPDRCVDLTGGPNNATASVVPSPFGTPPLHTRKKLSPATNSVLSPSTNYNSTRSALSSSSSQWSSSRKTPPVSPGTHVGIATSMLSRHSAKNHNFLKPLGGKSLPSSNCSGNSARSNSVDSSSVQPDYRSRQPTPPASLINVLDSLNWDRADDDQTNAMSAVHGNNTSKITKSKTKSKSQKGKKKSKDYDEERRRARKERREKRWRRNGAGASLRQEQEKNTIGGGGEKFFFFPTPTPTLTPSRHVLCISAILI